MKFRKLVFFFDEHDLERFKHFVDAYRFTNNNKENYIDVNSQKLWI